MVILENNTHKFKMFSQKWEFEHKTSSSGDPQSTGEAESAVKTIKHLMQKVATAGQDPYCPADTASQGLASSPEQRLLSSRTQSLLPTKETVLKLKVSNNKQELINSRRRQERYYNRTPTDLHVQSRVQPFEPSKT